MNDNSELIARGVTELVLPPARSALVACRADTSCHEWVEHPRGPPAGGRRHARYRWIMGHQVAFGVWWVQAGVLRSIRASTPPAERIDAAVRLFDLYSVLLLYAGSCSPEVYAETVRADMRAWHPAFSGEWSRDYPVIPELVGRLRRAHSHAPVARLLDAEQRSRRVHFAVAAKLVPDGPSLLRAVGRRPARHGTAVENDLFDEFFHVRRAPLCQRAFAAQLGARLHRVGEDVRRNGLHGNTEPPRLPEVGRLERDAQALFRWLADWL